VRIFRRRRSRRHPVQPDPGEELRAAISSIASWPEEGAPVPPEDRARQLRRIVAEAVVLQDRAEEVLAGARAHEPLGDLAPRGGPLATRFFELRRQLPPPANAEMARQCETASVVLDHHGTLIVTALELLAAEWRSPAIAEQLDRIDGLGPPAERLDALYAELAHRGSLAGGSP
jgi:hypothetical protein